MTDETAWSKAARDGQRARERVMAAIDGLGLDDQRDMLRTCIGTVDNRMEAESRRRRHLGLEPIT